MEKDTEVPIFLIACIGYSQDRTFSVLGRVAGAYWNEALARERAQYETLGYLELNNKRYKQEAAVLRGSLKSGSPVKRIFVVFSNAYLKDSTGRCGFKIDGIFAKEPDADECFQSIKQGLCDVQGFPAEITSQKVELEIQ